MESWLSVLLACSRRTKYGHPPLFQNTAVNLNKNQAMVLKSKG